MSSPLQYDGAPGGNSAKPYGTRSVENVSVEPSDTVPPGFSDTMAGFQFDSVPISTGQRSAAFETARKKVEDLLEDAGIPAPLHPRTSSSPIIDLGLRSGENDQAARVSECVPAKANDRFAKRAIDLAGSITAGVLFAPLMALIAIGLALEGGPVLYKQVRVGRAGRRFSCLKFRTMRPDAEDRLKLLLACNDDARAEWRKHQKLADDPRVTPLGRVLRETSLDELPQLVNVLRGEMSLVGPRPIVAPEVPGYDADREYFGSAAFVEYSACLPGITGLWQVSGRHRTIYLDRVRLDRQYVRTWSLWLDLKILWRTVGVVLRRSGS